MPDYEYIKLKKKYKDFARPFAMVLVNGKDFVENENKLAITNVEVELTAGFEAAVASFCIFNAFDAATSQFALNKDKKYILLGSAVIICMGYAGVSEPVFCGYISRVNFIQESGGAPYIKVTAMDIKGVMMAGSYARQIKVSSYGEAVKEILDKTVFHKFKEKNIMIDVRVSNTPDYQEPGREEKKASAETIEMVSESDYEFVVKAAKKFQYEFFTNAGSVYFRKAKSDSEFLIGIGPKTGLHTLDVEYDMTGLVEEIEVRSMDVDKARVISAKKKYKNKVSKGNHAKVLLRDSKKIYIDSTINSKEMAEQRAASLYESISYRFGSFRCKIIGLPELTPGRFIRLAHIGSPVENTFYLTRVRHVQNNKDGYYTQLEGIANGLS